MLVLAGRDGAAEPPDPDVAWAETEAAWRERVPGLEQTVAHARRPSRLRGPRGPHEQRGGMVAAATMSLPERAREGRNYDYRYVWIRDQCYAGQAVAKAGAYPLLDDAVRFVRDRLLDDGAAADARVHGERRSSPRRAPAGPARVSRRDGRHRQLGQRAVPARRLRRGAAAVRRGRTSRPARRGRLARRGDRGRRDPRLAGTSRTPGSGSSSRTQWTHSRLICAAGLRAISACGPGGEQAASWLALADAITADTSADALHPSGRWQRSPDDTRLDAALLLPAIRGAIPHDDPRSLATLHAFAQELTDDGYAYRFRPDERPLGDAEGAFLLCGFIASLAYANKATRLRRSPLVRAQPRRLRSARPLRRGVRRDPAPAARQPAASVRPRAAARMRRGAASFGDRVRGAMRPLTRLRVAYGVVLVLTPRLLTGALMHREIDARAIALARVLGLRHLLEAAIVGRRAGPRWTLVGAAVDATHSATMICFAVARPRWRPLAIASACTASAIAAVEISEACRQHRLDVSAHRPRSERQGSSLVS